MSGTPGGPSPSPSLKPWIGWLLTLLTVLGVALLALWWVKGVMANPVPSVTPSPTVTPTDGAAALTDVDGKWCPANPQEPPGCVGIALPQATFESAPDAIEYVFPPDAAPGTDPALVDYGFAANLGDCWQATIGTSEEPATAALIYCPAGAASGDTDVDASDATVDRLWITQDLTSAPMVRATES